MEPKPIVQERRIELHCRLANGDPFCITFHAVDGRVFAHLPLYDPAGDLIRLSPFPGDNVAPDVRAFSSRRVTYGMDLVWSRPMGSDGAEGERWWEYPVIIFEADTYWQETEITVFFAPPDATTPDDRTRVEVTVRMSDESAAALAEMWDHGWQQVWAERGEIVTREQIIESRNYSIERAAQDREWEEERKREREQGSS